MAGKISNNKGLSAVVTAMIMIALAIAMVAIIWLAVGNLVDDQLDSAGSCVESFGKVSINNRYTCYNSTSNELQFSISIGDLDVNSVLVGISGEGSTINLNIKNETGLVTNLVTYPSRSTNIALPSKNGGLTYILDLTAAGFTGSPDSIEIIPIIGKNQCEVSDKLGQIDNCELLV